MSIPSGFRPRLLVEREEDERGTGEVDEDKPPILALFVDYLRLYRYDDWEAYEQQLADASEVDPEIQSFARYVLSSAVEAPIDKQGRISIPSFQRADAQLGKDVAIAGLGGWIEIWNRERFDADLSKTGARFPELQAGVAPKVGKIGNRLGGG